MKRAMPLFGLMLIICLLNGCASVNFYSKSDLTGKTGLRYYTAKPYLLVERNTGKDNGVKTTVVYLPDLVNPQYLGVKPGFGSNEIKLTFSNGSLSSYGSISESQLPETLVALAGLLSKSGYAVTQFSQPGVTSEATGEPDFKLYEIVIGLEGTILKEVAFGVK